MRRLSAITVGFVACLALAPAAQQTGQTPVRQPGLTFRSSVNYVEVDAIVTDASGEPARDLTCNDFVVTEDGKPQNLSVCSFVDIPIDRPDPPLFKTQPIEPDVVTNERAFDGRVFMIVLDGFHIAASRGLVVRREATKFIDRYLGENDIAAVVHVGNPSAGQEFTTNKRLLKAAIDRFTGQSLPSATANINADALAKANQQIVGFDPGPAADMDAPVRDYMARESVGSMRRLSEYMGELSGRRKALLLFSEGIGIELLKPAKNISELVGFETMPVDTSALIQAQQALFAAATRSNVSIYSIDPRGLTTGMEDFTAIGTTPAAPDLAAEVPGRDYSQPRIMSDLASESKLAQESLRTFSEQTGGLAMVNKNDMDEAFRRIVKDNSSYYVLGYRSADPRHDGRFHRVSVKVKRPGLQVRTRHGYYAPVDKATAGTIDPVVGMLRNPAAVSGLGMRASASVVKGLLAKSTVHLTIEFNGKDVALKPAAGYFTNDIDIQYMAVDMKGVPQVNIRDQANLRLRPDTKERFPEVGVRVVFEFDVAPGRYQLRVAAKEQLGGKIGSVFIDLDVPDFATARLALSDLMITAKSAPGTPTPNNQSTLGRVLATPTTVARTFAATDTLSAAVSIYDNDARAPHHVDYRAALTSDVGAQVFTRAEAKEASAMVAAKGGYSWVLDVPLTGLAPGRYVLSVDARSRLSGVDPVRKEVEIRIK